MGIAAVSSFHLSLALAQMAFAQAQMAPANDALPAVGEATVVGRDVARARTDAVQNAIREAAVSAAGRILSADLFARNKELLFRKLGEEPERWVKDYRFIREEKSGQKLRVDISAVMRSDRISEELARWGLTLPAPRRPRIGIGDFVEHAGVRTCLRTAIFSSTLADQFRSLNYIVDSRSSPENVDFVVRGECSREGDRWLTVVAQGAFTAPSAALPTQRLRTPLGEKESTATGWLALALLERILPPWLARQGESGSYEITLPSKIPYRIFAQILELAQADKDGFRSGKETLLSTDRLALDVAFDGSAKDLLRAIEQKVLLGTSWKGSVVDARSIRVDAK